MIIEITTIEFLSLVGKSEPIEKYVSYMDLYEMAKKIEDNTRGIRVNVSERSFISAINLYRLECSENKIKINSLSFKRMSHSQRISANINSKLIQILKDS